MHAGTHAASAWQQCGAWPEPCLLSAPVNAHACIAAILLPANQDSNALRHHYLCRSSPGYCPGEHKQAYVLAESKCSFLPYQGEARQTHPRAPCSRLLSKTRHVGAHLCGQLPEQVGDARHPGIVLEALEQHGRVPDGELWHHLPYARHGTVHHVQRQRQPQLLRDDQEVADLLRVRRRPSGAVHSVVANARQLTRAM